MWYARWEFLSPAIIVVASQVFILLERFFPYDKGQKLFRKGWALDFFGYSLIQSYVLGLIITAIIHFIDIHTSIARIHVIRDLPIWAQIGFFLITHDFYIYCFHRLQHRFPILWRTHEAHHSVENVDWLAGSRSHPLEILINQTIEFAPILLLGSPEMALIKPTIDAVWGMYIHSNINVKSGALQYVINGPEMHRWHHSREYVGYGMNYGTKFAFWDYLFGTAWRPDRKPPGYGLDDDFPQGYFGQVLYAFRRFDPPPATKPTETGDAQQALAAPSLVIEGAPQERAAETAPVADTRVPGTA